MFERHFLNPNGILKNSNKPKGVIMAVFSVSSGAVGIGWYDLTRPSLKISVFRVSSVKDHVNDEYDTYLEQSGYLNDYNSHMEASPDPFWEPCVKTKPMDF